MVGIPKTIDNDVDLIDRSFGFQTSVEAAQVRYSDAIQSLQILCFFLSPYLRPGPRHRQTLPPFRRVASCPNLPGWVLQAAIRSAKTEAICNLPNGIGIVKLMGRSAGFIAVHATLASGDVDLCLVPEVPIVLDGPTGRSNQYRNQSLGWRWGLH